jgi:hypothetical protein
MEEAVDLLDLSLKTISGLNTIKLNNYNPNTFSDSTALPDSVTENCLVEINRITVFLRGLDEAISASVSKSTIKPIRILYTTSDSCVALILPLLSFYFRDELIVDLIVADKKMVQVSNKIIKALGLKAYIGDVFHGDASTFKLQYHYDVIISESMCRSFKKSTQIATLQSLISQNGFDCIFIPQLIQYNAALIKRGEIDMQSVNKENIKRLELGELFSVHKHNFDSKLLVKSCVIPYDNEVYDTLRLSACIHVFQHQKLLEEEPLDEYVLGVNGLKRIDFWYDQGENAGIRYRMECNAVSLEIKKNDKLKYEIYTN